MQSRTFPKNKNKIQKRFKPLQRKLHINGEVWTYKIGSFVLICDPKGDQRYTICESKILNMSYDNIEREHWKKTNSANIAPALVKQFIIQNILVGAVREVAWKKFQIERELKEDKENTSTSERIIREMEDIVNSSLDGKRMVANSKLFLKWRDDFFKIVGLPLSRYWGYNGFLNGFNVDDFNKEHFSASNNSVLTNVQNKWNKFAASMIHELLGKNDDYANNAFIRKVD